MTKMTVRAGVLLVLLTALCGCGANYSWRSSVPARLRAVHVPTFRNESRVMEAGAVASRQLLRELQREGSFKIASDEDAALEIQGTVKQLSTGSVAYDRRSGLRISSYGVNMVVEVSVIDRTRGTVVIDNRQYSGSTSFSLYQDSTTGLRDAAGRAADEIAQHVVDDLYNMKWDDSVKGGNGNE